MHQVYSTHEKKYSALFYFLMEMQSREKERRKTRTERRWLHLFMHMNVFFRRWKSVSNSSIVKASGWTCRRFVLPDRAWTWLRARTHKIQFPGQTESTAQTRAVTPTGATLAAVSDRKILVDERNRIVVVQMLFHRWFESTIEIRDPARWTTEVGRRRGRIRK